MVGSTSFMNKECAGLAGCWRIAMRTACGMTSLSSSSRFTVSSVDMTESPVMLPPGRARPAIKPLSNGSAAAPMTIGMLCVARCAAPDYDDIDLRPQQIADQRGYRFDIIPIMAKLVGDVAPFDITEVAHPAREFLAEWIVVRGSRPDVPDTRRLARLLRARRERPSRCRAAEQRDELAALHSITSSAATSKPGGTVRPSAFAVLRLSAVSYRVGACAGRSAGLSPRRMRSR